MRLPAAPGLDGSPERSTAVALAMCEGASARRFVLAASALGANTRVCTWARSYAQGVVASTTSAFRPAAELRRRSRRTSAVIFALSGPQQDDMAVAEGFEPSARPSSKRRNGCDVRNHIRCDSLELPFLGLCPSVPKMRPRPPLCCHGRAWPGQLKEQSKTSRIMRKALAAAGTAPGNGRTVRSSTMQEITRVRALCCQCGNLRTVSARYAHRFEPGDAGRSFDDGRSSAQCAKRRPSTPSARRRTG